MTIMPFQILTKELLSVDLQEVAIGFVNKYLLFKNFFENMAYWVLY